MIYIMELEPLEERYTAQWKRWVPDALDMLGLEFSVVSGKMLTKSIETGSVLDAHGTSYWKSTQMAELIERIYKGEVKDGDTVWFADLWFPGIEHLAYIRDLTGIKFKITGVLHAGSWDKDDFVNRTGISEWCKGFEQTLLQIADEIHVGTQFHKDLIEQDIDVGNYAKDKIKVTGLFFDAKEVRKHLKDVERRHADLVVFCQRLDPEKKPELFDQLKEKMFKDGSDLVFIKTRDVVSTKAEYYDMLSTAQYAVSFDGQETFGYTVLECMALGVTPLVANAKAYKETVPPNCRWNSLSELEGMLKDGKKLDPHLLWEWANRYAPVEVARKMFL